MKRSSNKFTIMILSLAVAVAVLFSIMSYFSTTSEIGRAHV